MNYTKKEWKVFNHSVGVGVTTGESDIALCSGFDSTRSRDEEIANAKLIAAAPELLAACEKAEELLSPFEESGFLGEHALNIVRAAIAKATQ